MSFEECLNDCLDRLQRGESLEACLTRYPEHADDLRGLLQAAQVLRASPPPLSVTAQSRGRERMHRAAEQQATKRWQVWPRRLALPLAAAIVAVFLVVVAGAARSSAPGDLAYPLRRFAETAALRLTADPISRAERHLELAEQRLAEVQERWQAERGIDRGVLTEGVNEIGEALGELAQATNDPNRAKSVLTELAAVAYETRAWVLSVTPEAPAARNELEGIAAQLTVYEQWAQAGLFDLASLQGFLRGETPPLLPTLLPQVPTAVPTPPAAAATAGPTVTETQAIVAPTIASLGHANRSRQRGHPVLRQRSPQSHLPDCLASRPHRLNLRLSRQRQLAFRSSRRLLRRRCLRVQLRRGQTHQRPRRGRSLLRRRVLARPQRRRVRSLRRLPIRRQ